MFPCLTVLSTNFEVMASGQRKQISMSDKLEIVNAVVHGENQPDIATAMGLCKHTMSSIVNNKSITSKQVGEK